jgi:polyisoprenoid-binding protein YceI
MTIRALNAAIGLAVALAGICRGLANGAESRVGVLTLDPAKTLVEFKLGTALHTTHGNFRLKRGTIKAGETTGKAEGEIVVDATSGKSGDFLRDNRMTDSVLEAVTWPEITFDPRHIDGHLDGQGNFHAKLAGVLMLHGAAHNVVIETQGSLKDHDLIAMGHLSIPYVDWGLKDPSILFLSVDKKVEIDIATAGHVTWLSSGRASAPPH